VEVKAAEFAAVRQLYTDAVSVASSLWESAGTEGEPDATLARRMVDGLAEAVVEHRTALVALATFKNGRYNMSSHMVNVSILTMAQAEGLGIDGPLLREFGLAALMHDIGKVRTPAEILHKPDKLSEWEFEIMKRHTVEGADILARTPEIPAMAPVVALEHHRRLDGSGYPYRAPGASISVGTMLCSIADVYDAMRSQRLYQRSDSADRVLNELTESGDRHFNGRLVGQFVQLVGIYPVGTLVQLNTGEVAVVLKTYVLDLGRPEVRVLLDRAGQRLGLPYDVNLWDATDPDQPSSITTPLNPSDYPFDPLTFI
jgi:putative nucleotidyltransferase with HDIG domain